MGDSCIMMGDSCIIKKVVMELMGDSCIMMGDSCIIKKWWWSVGDSWINNGWFLNNVDGVMDGVRVSVSIHVPTESLANPESLDSNTESRIPNPQIVAKNQILRKWVFESRIPTSEYLGGRNRQPRTEQGSPGVEATSKAILNSKQQLVPVLA